MANDDIVEGKLKQAEGQAQDALGDVTDSPEDDAQGKLKQAEGAVQEGYGKVKEAIHDATK